jgi:two-component system cell cycle response regulator DivK
MPRVLVVEDNPINMELITALLEGEGCEAIAAETAPDGLCVAAAAQPDLILMDVQLPVMTGYEATRRLKADPRTAQIPVVAVTAHAMRGEEARAREAGCDAYLTKPVDLQRFREVLWGLLGGVAGGATTSPTPHDET